LSPRKPPAAVPISGIRIVSVAVWLEVLKVPLIVTVCWLPLGNVLIVKLTLVAPAGTVTVAGTGARAGLVLESFTTTPPIGAAAASVTVPVVETTAGILAGFKVTDEMVCALDRLPRNTISNGAHAKRTPRDKPNLEIFTLNPPQDFHLRFSATGRPDTQIANSLVLGLCGH
jgi:hypothetical protein